MFSFVLFVRSVNDARYASGVGEAGGSANAVVVVQGDDTHGAQSDADL